MSPEKQRGGAYKLPWKTPKIITNAVRLSRGAWTIAAAIDDLGLLCYQNLHSIWPTGNVPLEVIAAVLNGPVANAFLSTHSTTQHNKAETIENMPFPKFNPAQAHRIASLVREYIPTLLENVTVRNVYINPDAEKKKRSSTGIDVHWL